MGKQALLIRVYGIVQGVGFRPSVDRIAVKNRICGSVCNKGPYVEIDAQGTREDLDAFLYDLEHHPPERAVILKIDVEEAPQNIGKDSCFSIIESEKEEGEIFVSPDIATCERCKSELFDPNDRRYLHPFINCTSCGPRMTILDGMPYDRIRTSMKEFPMCPECEYEYTHSETRRYDAQPVCCNDCGPQVYLLHPQTDPEKQKALLDGLPVDVSRLPESEKDAAAITAARRVVAGGGIIAVKGIGGFHLCCDATNPDAVARLRRLKTRPQKPFAVMMKDLDTVRRECELIPLQEEILDGHQKPIILLQKKGYYAHLDSRPAAEAEKNGKADKREQPLPDRTVVREESSLQPRLAEGIAPGNPTVGVMLPYAPVQMLLFTYTDGVSMPDCLVMTSGNISGAPICRDDADAIRELGGMCDLILSHNRLIRLRADDTVMDFFEGKPYMIRRSRGYAPLPFMREADCPGTVLAVGGELKNTFCVGKHHLFYPSPYVGDMADLRTVRALTESITRMEHLLEAEPELVACDLHPKYNTTDVAAATGLPMVQIQHHYAHIVSCLAENEYDGEVIGVSFDGTGYGTDGTIWGGEILKANCREFTRLGSIMPFVQIGGDASAKEGWRIAVSMIYGYYRDKEKAWEIVDRLGLCDKQTFQLQVMMAERGINAVRSTSAGRLFDAVSAILGIRRASTFEGEASTSLQFAADAYEAGCGADRAFQEKQSAGVFDETDVYKNGENAEENLFRLPTDRLFINLLTRRLAGEESGWLAWEFHRGLADQIVAACEYAKAQTGLQTAALSGGVFQNRLLLRMCTESLRDRGYEVLIHSMVPPNDGGIALGQAVAAMEILKERKEAESGS